MPETETDAKEDISTDAGSESSTDQPDMTHLDQEHIDENSDNLISTIDDDGADDLGSVDISSGGAREVAETEEDLGDKPGEETETDTTDKVETETETKTETKTDDDKSDRYDKDPAWQRIIKERDAALAENTKLKEQRPDETKDFIDLKTKTEDEIAEWIEDDPIGFAENQRKIIKHEVKIEMRAEQQEKDEQSKIDATFDSYSEKNPDNDSKTGFVQMWESGAISRFIDKHPGHTAISAHMILTEESRTQSVQEQIDKGIAEGVEKEKKRLAAENKARKRTIALNQGPAYTAKESDDDELKDTKSKGGKVAVMAARLKRMRQGAHA